MLTDPASTSAPRPCSQTLSADCQASGAHSCSPPWACAAAAAHDSWSGPCFQPLFGNPELPTRLRALLLVAVTFPASLSHCPGRSNHSSDRSRTSLGTSLSARRHWCSRPCLQFCSQPCSQPLSADCQASGAHSCSPPWACAAAAAHDSWSGPCFQPLSGNPELPTRLRALLLVAVTFPASFPHCPGRSNRCSDRSHTSLGPSLSARRHWCSRPCLHFCSPPLLSAPPSGLPGLPCPLLFPTLGVRRCRRS